MAAQIQQGIDLMSAIRTSSPICTRLGLAAIDPPLAFLPVGAAADNTSLRRREACRLRVAHRQCQGVGFVPPCEGYFSPLL